jgi:hypothetical protein
MSPLRDEQLHGVGAVTERYLRFGFLGDCAGSNHSATTLNGSETDSA